MLDHIGIFVSDAERSKAFYRAALAPLGIELLMSFGDNHGFGSGGKPCAFVLDPDGHNIEAVCHGG